LAVVSLYSTHSTNDFLFEEGLFKVHIQEEKLDYFFIFLFFYFFFPILLVFLEVLKPPKRHSDFSWDAAIKN